jgi:small-conductance mechanosensitive channel
MPAVALDSLFPFGYNDSMRPDYQYLYTLLIITGVTGLLLLARKLLFRFLRRLAQRTTNHIDDLLLEGLEGPSVFLILTLALYVSLRLSALPESYVRYVAKAIYLSLILTITMGLANVSGRTIAYFMKKVDLPISVTSLLYSVTKALVYGVGILMMLNAVGVSITPIITALGVGGLAMALALQDTLSNLFAGIHILAEHTIRVGDFIKLETGQEGFVEDISWRTTRIRMLPNNMVIVPNSKLAQSVVTNYYLPERRAVILVPISVSYDADAEVVERILIEEALKATTEVEGLLREPAPAVRFVPGFGASSLDFTLACHVREIVDQQPVMHELHKRIWKRFKLENIDIPYPTRTVYLKRSAARGLQR